MKNSTSVSEIIRYPIFVLTLIGCSFVVKNCKETWQRIQRSKIKRVCIVCVSILATIIHFSSVVKLVAFMIHALTNFDNFISFFIQAYIYCLYGTIVYLCEYLSCHWYLAEVMESLQNYGYQFGFCKELCSLKKPSLFASVFFTLGIIATCIILIFVTVAEGDLYLIYPLELSLVALNCLTIFCCVTVLLPLALFVVLYTALTEIVAREFRDTSAEMMRIMNQQTDMQVLEEEFSRIRSRHVTLCHVVMSLSKLVRLNACVNLLFSVSILFFALYALSSEKLSTTYVILEVGLLLWNTAPVVASCMVWGRIPSAAHSIIDSIGMAPKSGVSRDLMLQMQLFVSVCSSRRVGIDVFGLFTLDSQTIIMVLGTVVTYGLVVIQFQQDQDRTVECTFLNSSFVH